MRGLKTMLFGIAVILCSGFTVAAYPYYSFLLWVMLLGLAISFVGLLMSDPDERGGTGTESSDGRNGENGVDDDMEEDGADEDDENSEGVVQDSHYYSTSRFPPI